jgi:hypothetical protein
VPKVHKDLQGQRGQQEQRAHRDQLEQPAAAPIRWLSLVASSGRSRNGWRHWLARRAQLERPVPLDLQAQQARKALRVHKGQPALRVHKALLVQSVRRVMQALQAPLVRRDLLVQRGQPARRVRRAW